MTFEDRQQALYYRILVKDHLDPSWGSWFEGMNIQNLPDGETRLSGPIADQAMLHGLLIKIRDLGLPLISLHCLPPEQWSQLDPLSTEPTSEKKRNVI